MRRVLEPLELTQVSGTSPSTIRGPGDPARAASAQAWIGAGLVAAAFGGLFWNWFWTQHLMSRDNPQDWGHAYVIPLISGYLAWRRRAEIAAQTPRTFWPALAPMLAGIFGYAFFNVGYPNHMFQAASMVITLGAALLLMLGPGIFRFLALPVLFLLFMSTISEAVMNVVTFPLQLLASKGAWLILALLGKPLGYGVEVAGNNLTLYPASGAPVPLNVAEQCSGMRMVIAFIALASAYALLGCRWWWERLAMVLIASPVAILMNVVRVAVLGLLSLIDPKLAEGQAHMLIGTLLLVPALGLYFLCHKALERVFVDPRATAKVQAQASERRVLRCGTPSGGAS